jgi:hypothetical protein
MEVTIMLELLLICGFIAVGAIVILSRIYLVMSGLQGYEQMQTEEDWGNQDLDSRMER